MPVDLLPIPSKRNELPAMDRILAEARGKPGELLTVLEELQKRDESNHLSREVLALVAQRLGLPMSKVYGVATFYTFFNLEPQGRHTLCVCRGTACHTRGSRALLDDARITLGVDEKEAKGKPLVTTRDGQFTIRTVACFGQCALAPVVEVNRKIYGHVNRQTIHALIAGVGASQNKSQKESRR